jgi:crotonobetainyl-CoA:carnitine CoA-transferase CaiB-like acyl-CoA transferase
VRSPFVVDGDRDDDTNAPPTLGEHTAVVLSEWLGWDDAHIAGLAGAGAFGKPSAGARAG